MHQEQMENEVLSFELPGFRFHPTEEELLEFYLKNVIFKKKVHFDVIGFLNIYHHDPWELPGLAKIGEREWYFFVPRERKPSNGGRPNRTTENGFWKATGSDRKVVSLSDPKRVIGCRKTLVFYMGRAPRGSKTDWVMNEYRLPDNCSLPKDIVLCKVYRKATSLKVLEQWAAKEEETTVSKSTLQFHGSSSCSYSTSPLSSNGATSYCGPQEEMAQPMNTCHVAADSENIEMWAQHFDEVPEEKPGRNGSLRLPLGQDGLPELQVPKIVDWTQDPLWAQIRSPWFESILSQLSTPPALANVL